MNPSARIRLAIILTVGTLVGALAAAILLLFHDTWRPGATVISVGKQVRNGRESVTWTLTAHRPVGVQVTASDPAYSYTWADENMWRRGKHWDRITVTAGDKEGSFVWEYKAERMRRATIGGSHGVGSEAKSLVFTDIRSRGHAPPGTMLCRFTLVMQDGQRIEGKMSLIEVTEELLYSAKRPNANDGQLEKAD